MPGRSRIDATTQPQAARGFAPDPEGRFFKAVFWKEIVMEKEPGKRPVDFIDQINIRLRAGEKQQIKTKAQAFRLDVSEYGRRLMLGKKIVTPKYSEREVEALWQVKSALNVIGGHMNQIAKQLNMQHGHDPVLLKQLLLKMETIVDRINRQFIRD